MYMESRSKTPKPCPRPMSDSLLLQVKRAALAEKVNLPRLSVCEGISHSNCSMELDFTELERTCKKHRREGCYKSLSVGIWSKADL